jgi:hypothetical protein
MPFSFSRRQLIYGLVLVHVVAVIGMSFAFQGWKSRFLTFDLLPHIQSARELVERGRIPDRGCLSRFGSHIPPGTTWLLAPGLLAFDDPRLYESIGSGILYWGTVVGIFLLARTYFGMRCALLSAALYGLSQLGLHFAGSLWPRGHPFFYVWMIYWTDRWVREKSAKYLAAALVTWGAGMYVFMEIAPALFVLPVVWLLHRPPVRLRPLLFAAVVILALWSPYLQFEAGRRFIDLRSQVQRKYILPSNYKDAWCSSNARLEVWTGQTYRPFVSFGSKSGETVEERSVFKTWSRLLVPAIGVAGLLLANFQRVAQIPGASLILALLVVASMVWLSLTVSSLNAIRRFCDSWSKPIAWGLIVCGVLGNEFFLARLAPDRTLAPSTLFAIRMLQVVFLLSGMVVLMQRYAIVSRLWDRATADARTVESGPKPGLLVVSLVIPWLILLVLVDPSWAPRLYWIWPLQVIFLAAAVTYLPSKLRIARPLSWMSQILLALIIFGNPLLVSRFNSWLESGHAGSDPEQIRAVDYIGGQLRSQGRSKAAIGYHVITSAYMPAFHILDPQYKVGAEFDFYFKHRHGISNTGLCAEGASPRDEYQIVQSISNGLEDYRFPFPANIGSHFQSVAQFGSYQVFKR